MAPDPDDLAELKRLADAGTPPSALALLPKHAELVERLAAGWGNLAAARRSAGLGRTRMAVRTKEAVIQALRKLDHLGVRVNIQELRRLGEEQLVRACFRIFGSWPAARAAAGLEVPPPRAHLLPPSDEEVRDQLLALASSDGTVNALPRHVARAARRRFGGVRQAVKAAGLVFLEGNQRWTRDRVIAALRKRLRDGRAITINAMRADGQNDLVMAMTRHIGSASEVAAVIGHVHAPRVSAQQAPRVPRLLPRRQHGELEHSIGVFAAEFIEGINNVIHAQTLAAVRLAFDRLQPPGEPAQEPVVHVPAGLNAVAEHVVAEHGISPSVAAVLYAAIDGVPRKHLHEVLGLSEHTVKTQVRVLITRTGHRDLDDLLWSIWQSDRQGRNGRRRTTREKGG